MRNKLGRFIKGCKPPSGAFKKGMIPWNKGKKGLQESWNKGKKLSLEHRKKMSISHIGQVAWNKGRKGGISPMKGKHHSEESNMKNRLAHLGKKHSEETKKRMRGRLMENSATWKGGRVKQVAGYIEIYNPSHPSARNHIYILEHRLIMEKHLGRYLTKDEIVHHINGNKTDNRIENLEIMTNSEHCKLHKPRLGTGKNKLSKISNH